MLTISQLCDRGITLEFQANYCKIFSKEYGKVVLEVERVNNVYITCLNYLPDNTNSFLSVMHNNTWLWHKRFGHVSSKLLSKLNELDLVQIILTEKKFVKYVLDANKFDHLLSPRKGC